MKKKSVLKLFSIILGVMMIFSFGKVEASEITSAFTGEILATRSTLETTKSSGVDFLSTTISKELKLSQQTVTDDHNYRNMVSKRGSDDFYQWNIQQSGEPNDKGQPRTSSGHNIWKIISNENSFEDLYYCLQADIGMGNQGENTITSDKYNISYDMHTEYSEIKSLISSLKISNQEVYNKILWILNNSYIPTGEDNYQETEKYKELMDKANIEINEDNRLNLTEDDIEVVQQMAIWYFSNPDDSNYNANKLPSLYLNGQQLSSIYLYTTTYGEQVTAKEREDKAKALYSYLITEASATYTREVPTLSISNTNAKVIESGNYYVIGEFDLNKSNISVTDVIVKLDNSELSSSDYLLVSSISSSTNVTNYNNLSKFYLKINKDKISDDSTIDIRVDGEYSAKILTFMTNMAEVDSTQPVVLVKEVIPTLKATTNIDIELTQVTVEKIWDDNDNQNGTRPETIEVQLYKTVDGTKKSMGEEYQVSLDEENSWKYTWENLLEKEDGKQIVYTVEEVEVPEGYTVTYSDDTFTITNTYVPRDLDIQILKINEQGDKITSSDATFEITGSQELTGKTNQGILDLNSEILVGNDFEFIYTIKETEAPIGYNKIEEELSVKISGTTKFEDGTCKIDTVNITDKDGNPLDDKVISSEYDETLNKVAIKIKNTRTINGYSVKLLKVSEDGTTPISGAWFKIDDGQAILVSETGEEIATGTLSEAGELNLTYKIEETTAPEGYIKIDGQKEVKINAKVELKDNEYQLTEVKLVENVDGITVSEEDNVITIKVKNAPEIITGKYNVVLRKVDENGNILTGSKFEVDGKEYDLSTGEVILLQDTDLTSTKDINLTYPIKETTVPEGYEGIEDTTIYIKGKIQKQENSYKLIRAELVDSEENVITNENISVEIEGDSIVISVINKPIPKKLDLSLRKFITQINDIEYSRAPVVDTSKLGTIVDEKVVTTATYKHTKEPIAVQKGDIVTYTIRVYNEGEVDGYVEMITDHLPDNLLPILSTVDGIDTEKYEKEIKFNEDRLWQQIDNAKNIFTTITSKSNSDTGTYSVLTGLEEVTDTKLDAYVEGSDKLDYIDVQIKCLVTDSAVSNEYLTNIAEISKMCDADGVEVITDRDSTKFNADISNLADYKNDEAINSTQDSYIEGQEDDDDFEKLVVKEFDLSLRKFITKVNETSYSREPIVDTSKLGTTVDGKVITTATYNHSKEPVIVETNDLVTYTIRIYNEGTLAGYANEITDDIPEGLEFMPNSDVNISYRWKMLDSDGNETEDVSKAVMIVTDYLSDIDKNNVINPISEVEGVKTLSYKDVEVQFKVVAKAENLKDNIIINEAQISADSDRDIDSDPNRNEKYDYTSGNNEDDIDYEPIKLQYFDLALRKFITKVNLVDYNNRYPEIVYNEDGSITYNHTKDPVLVTTNDTVIYTIRVYNEGEKAGYANEITDNLPDGLEFVLDNEINKQYGWKLLDSEENVTEDLSKAVKFSTDYLKNELIDALVEENGQKILSYKDVQIAFKVIEPNTSDRILVNIAEISEDSDEDIDSIPGNNVLTEDDIDREYLKVQYFDLSLKKWVTRTEVTYNGKTTTTKTGFTEDTDELAKVDLVASKMKKTTVKFAYNIKVTNEGELPGYAYEVKDYIPKGLKFVAEDNKDWKELEDGSVVTDKLKDTLLNPGESATVEIVLTWKNSTTNTGIKTNYAEISQDSADDIDSTPDNYNLKEDDIDDAQVILSIKTAGAKTYIGLVLLTVAILAGGIVLIKKYVID